MCHRGGAHLIFETTEENVQQEFASYLERHSEVYVVVSPPRCSSTAFSRVLWEEDSVRFYCHEPFETTYYRNEGLPEALRKLKSPLDLARPGIATAGADALVIKEMPYQVGRHFPLLASLTRRPLVFLMRNPRLSIASRMEKKREVGDDPRFPMVETGWELWRDQIEWCRREGVDHLLLDSTDFRNHPESTFPEVCTRLGLAYSPDMLDWKPCPEVELDNLGGQHRHLYSAVLGSSGIRAETVEPPPLSHFPAEGGWRDHVEHCLAIYDEMLESSARVTPLTLALDSR